MTQPQIDAQVINYITSLYKIFGEYPKQSGGCYKFALHLQNIFGGELYYNSDHVIIKIGSSYFDINGRVKNTTSYLQEYKFGEKHLEESFKEHL